jgi:polysaccharide export outer membrane protein
MNTLNRIFILLIAGIIFYSCAPKEDLVYFHNASSEDFNDSLFIQQTPRLKSGDLLTINVSGPDLQAVIPFNLPVTPYVNQNNGNAVSAQASLQNYLIDNYGNIQFPVLGEIKLAGMTRVEATKWLEEQISEYVTDPIVNIRITNFTVSVLGSVNRPGTFTIDDERITVLEALSMAGDSQIYGERQDVRVLRDVNGHQEFYTIDLTSENVVNSPVYYLQQNDVVYVSPNKPQVNSSRYSPNYSVIVSLAAVLISLISVIAP